MNKEIYKYEDVKEKIKLGLDTIADPIRQTLSPKGGNVLFENSLGDCLLTNDGITIAKEISVKDRLVNAVIDTVKEASLRTNAEAGDGTTSTVILSTVLAKEALKLRDEGLSWIDIKREFNQMGQSLIKHIDDMKLSVSSDADIRNIALISSNNDNEIADKVLDIIKTAGEDGMVFLEGNNTTKTDIHKDLGFMVKSGILYQELLWESKPIIKVNDVRVLVTDKRIYYAEEAEKILRIAIENGWRNIAIVAREFMGEAVPVFVANHKKNVNVILIKDVKSTEKDNTSLDDLAMYIGGNLTTERTGNLVNNITPKDFVLVNSIYQDAIKTLITPKFTASKSLKERIKYLREELKKDKDNREIKERLSSLTNGVVTVKVGGSTGIEIREKIYRYEDAVNAARAAMRHGYLVGGGVSLLRAYNVGDYSPTMQLVATRLTEALVRQIATNCGKHPDTMVETIKKSKKRTFGYNALTDEYTDLLKAGVIDAYLVIKMAIENSISVANSIASINYYLINEVKEDDTTK